MKKITLSLIPLAVIFLGCAAPTQLANLKTPQSPPIVTSLPNNACMTFDGAFGKEAEVCVLAGRYQLEKENSEGVLFRGILPSVYWKNGGEFVLFNGGVWMPKSGDAQPRIYFYHSAGQINGKSVS